MKRINKDLIFEVFESSEMKREIEKVFGEEDIEDFSEDFFDLVCVIIGSGNLFVEE